jgi:hypothetical protein
LSEEIMGWICRKTGVSDVYFKIFVGILQAKWSTWKTAKDVGINIKNIVQKQTVRLWTRLNWLRIIFYGILCFFNWYSGRWRPIGSAWHWSHQ